MVYYNFIINWLFILNVNSETFSKFDLIINLAANSIWVAGGIMCTLFYKNLKDKSIPLLELQKRNKLRRLL